MKDHPTFTTLLGLPSGATISVKLFSTTSQLAMLVSMAKNLEHPAFFRFLRHSKGIRDRLRQGETSMLLIKESLLGIIADIHNPAVGILLKLIN
jgi:hypothetical protein